MGVIPEFTPKQSTRHPRFRYNLTIILRFTNIQILINNCKYFQDLHRLFCDNLNAYLYF
jgi:hypothetical protein